jgi:hypothetical protein
MMEAVRTYETLVNIFHAIRRNRSEHRRLNIPYMCATRLEHDVLNNLGTAVRHIGVPNVLRHTLDLSSAVGDPSFPQFSILIATFSSVIYSPAYRRIHFVVSFLSLTVASL